MTKGEAPRPVPWTAGPTISSHAPQRARSTFIVHRPDWARRDWRPLIQVLSALIPGLIAALAVAVAIVLAGQGVL